MAGNDAPPLRIVSYEDRAVGMDSLVLMAESLCRADPEISLHLTVPDAPASVRGWAATRPKVILTTTRPAGVSGWDVKAWLLLRELSAGAPEALWLDADMIVMRPVSAIVREFPRDVLIVAEEWDRPPAIPVAHCWGFTEARPVLPVNSCFVRVTPAHRPLLERWLGMTRDPRYREAQKVPFERRPFHLASDQVLLTALLSSGDFGAVRFSYIRIGRHIAQCAGSASYRPRHRVMDLFRGLPPLIHAVGRKPWQPAGAPSGPEGAAGRFLMDLATDLSPYVLASRRLARELGLDPEWLRTRTTAGALLIRLSRGHPGLAGLPLALLQSLQMTVTRADARRHRASRAAVAGPHSTP